MMARLLRFRVLNARDVRLRRRLLAVRAAAAGGWSSRPSRPSARSSSTRWGCPTTLTFVAFARAWEIGLGTFMFNSALVTFLSVLLIVIASGMAAYVLARSEYPVDALGLSPRGGLLRRAAPQRAGAALPDAERRPAC